MSHHLFSRGVFTLLAMVSMLGAMGASDASAQSTDPSFGAVIQGDQVQRVALQPDGRVLVAGEFTHINGVATTRLIARLMPDGSTDTSFLGPASTFVYDMAVQPDGRIVIAAFGASGQRIMRLMPDGSVDPSFTQSPIIATKLLLQPDGKILWSYATVGRLNADGTVDNTFQNPQAHNIIGVSDIALAPDGKILVAGQRIELTQPPSFFGVSRLNSDGSLDSTFVTTLSTAGLSVARFPDGRIQVGYGDSGVFGSAQLEANGAIIAGRNLDLQAQIVDIEILPDGQSLIAGATFPTARPYLRRLTVDGLLDSGFTTFAGAPPGNVQDVVSQPDGRIIAGGTFGGVNIVRLFSTTSVPENHPPTIGDMPGNQSIIRSSSGSTIGPLYFSVSDPDGQQLTVTATSSNPAVIPAGALLLAGTSTTRTIRISHPPNGGLGVSTITLTVTDGSLSASASFTVTVSTPNVAPVISAIGNQVITDNGSGASTAPLPFTVTDGDGHAVVVTATSSNQAVVSTAGIVLGGSGTNRTVTVASVPGTVGGTSTITLNATDGIATVSRTFLVTVNVAPSTAPRNLSSRVSGNVVTLTWQPPLQGTPLGYVIEAGFGRGGANIVLPVGSATSVSVSAPNGTFFIRVRAQSLSGASGPSNEIEVTVGGLPLPPLGLAGSVAGSVVTFSWVANGNGPAPTSYVLTAGTLPGASNIAALPLPGSARSFSTAAPAGSYYVRVHAVNASGASSASNEVRVDVGGCSPPPTPSGVTASPSAGSVSIAWSPSPGAVGYVLAAGTSSGATNVGTFTLPGTSISTAAPPGTYFVRVMAVGPCGTSAASAETIFTVPGVGGRR